MVANLDIFGINSNVPLGEDKQGAEQLQSYGRQHDVSPIFTFSNATEVLAGKEDIIDFATSKPKSLKYLPFNTLQVINNSSVAILLFINQRRDRPILVPAGVIMPIDNTIAPAINSILWKNNDSSTTVAVEEVVFMVFRDNVTTDLIMKRVHQLLFRGKGLTRR